MLGVAIRIAERMGIHSEARLAKCSTLEAEMRRRLWWSLVSFDSRVGELADYKVAKLNPTWDCRVPLNVNDSDLQSETRELPEVIGKPTEALFAVVSSELRDFVRNTMFYLDFTTPSLKPIARDVQNGPVPEGGELVNLEKMVEDKYIKFCNPENPLQFMTIWSTRAFLAKNRLVEHHSKYSSSSIPQTEPQRDIALSLALDVLKCDTKLVISPLVKGFIWLTQFYFPFPAYIQIVQDLKKRPLARSAEEAWVVMSANYEARFGDMVEDNNHFFRIFNSFVLQAWEARELKFKELGTSLMLPNIVQSMRKMVAERVQSSETSDMQQAGLEMEMNMDDFMMSMPMEFGSYMYGLPSQGGHQPTGPLDYPPFVGAVPLGLDMNQLDWSAMS
jgi:hypothetical protein